MDYRKTLNLPQTKFPMRANLPQREPEILSFWEEKEIYGKIRKKREGSPNYTLHDGPPYADGDVHLGTALNKILKDIVIKYKTMRGFDAPYIPGWDCHGLPVEHQLFKDLGISKDEISQLEFRKKARRYAYHFVKRQRGEFKRLGILGRWADPYLTMSPSYEAEIIKAFGELARKGYIYRGLKPIHWCIKCRTALAEAEIEYKEKESPSIYVKFPIKGNLRFLSSPLSVYILIWTTTPWTLPANFGIVVHPELDYSLVRVGKEILILARDLLNKIKEEARIKEIEILSTLKGRQLEGIKYIHPFMERESEILLADFVNLEEGTGCVHVAPGHGEEDYLLGLKYNLPVFSPVDEEGKFTTEIKEFQEMPVFAANPLIVKKLEQERYLLSSGSIHHSYPHCWRCGSPLIFRATPQWFLNVDKHNLRKKAIKAVLEEVEWVPPQSMMRIKSMLEERPDWCLSRQRYWGVGIPAIYCQSCGEVMVKEEIIQKVQALIANGGSDSWFKKGIEEIVPPGFKCPKCGKNKFKKEEDILDVWFESGVSHQAVVAREKSLQDPTDLYLEGSDQHRGWFQVSLLTSLALKERPPYRKVVTNGFTVDSQGRKMSKSLGNVVDPQGIIENKGADILRLWASLVDYTQDIRISDEILNYTVEVYRRIRNTYRFLLGNTYDFDPGEDGLPFKQMREIDRWMLSRLEKIIKKVTASFEAFKFYEAVHLLHNFVRNELSSFYFDILKDRLYTFSAKSRGRRSAQMALHQSLLSLIKLVAPILSFTSEEAWGYIKSSRSRDRGPGEESIFLSSWPEVDESLIDEHLEERWRKILEVRDKVLKRLEERREEGKIGASLEAKVLISAPHPLIFLLRDLGDQLKEVFIVSQVELKEGKELKIKVKRAEGEKCQRCWNYTLRVGENKEHPDLCERCWKTVASNFGD